MAKKYIDAEKLKYEIERRKLSNYYTDTDDYETELFEIIDYLQQEQQDMNLEKEFNVFLDNIEGAPRMWHSDEQIEWAKDIARHFYELGKNSK